MSSLVVDTSTLALEALGDLESADEIPPAIEQLRGAGSAPGRGPRAKAPSLAMRMVTH